MTNRGKFGEKYGNSDSLVSVWMFQYLLANIAQLTSLLRRRSLGSSRISPPRAGEMRDEPKERLRRRLAVN